MNGLCDWLGGDGWFWVRSRLQPATMEVHNFDFLYGGAVDQTGLALWGDRGMRPAENDADELLALASEVVANGGKVTRTLDQLVTPEVWRKPANRAFVERFGFDQSIYSVRQIGADDGIIVSFVLLLRKIGQPAFDPHVASLVQVVMNELGPLHTDGLNVELSGGLASLTPRQRSVLACLIDGQSAKMIATNLAISLHTVNDHIKAIYRNYRVRSRAQLLRRFMTRN